MTEKEFLDCVKSKEINCGYGWYGLIMCILARVVKLNNDNPGIWHEITRFEEKSGFLNIVASEYCRNLMGKEIGRAMEASKQICEHCGCIGELRECGSGKHKTLCPECRNEYETEKRKFREIMPRDIFFDFVKGQNIQVIFGWYGLIFPILAEIFRFNISYPHPDDYVELTSIKGHYALIAWRNLRNS
jgi:hypothetical protein